MNLSIPHDLSIVSFNSVRRTLLSPPLFTCALQNAFETGVKAVELLQEQIAGQIARKVVMPIAIYHASSIMPPRPRIAEVG
jgi:DNA-binding LacI/PurR family transcriptional regulator